MNIRLSLVVYVLSGLVLSSCAALTPTIVAPASSEIPATLAPASTEAPATKAPASPTATIAPTPTEAPSPTPTGPKEGDMKVENGYTYTYTAIRTADGKAEYEGWFRPMTPTAIPMYDWQDSYYPDGKGGWNVGKDVAPITMLVEEGTPGADAIEAFKHTELPKRQGNNSYLQFLLNYLGGQNNEEWIKKEIGFQNGTFPVKVQFGNTTYNWYPSPDHGVKVYVLNYDNPSVSEENGYLVWTDAPYHNYFKSNFWGLDAQGNALGAIASQKPLDQLNQGGAFNELLIFPFYHVASMLEHNGEDLKQVRAYGFLLQQMMQSSQRSNPPYTEVIAQTPQTSPTPTITP